MRAVVGDRLRVRSHHVGTPDRAAEVVEVHGPDGAPPYVVRWDDGHESTFTPGSDAMIEQPRSDTSR